MTTYYNIPKSAWLFREQNGQRRTEDAKWTPAEESVRQWCLHELMRTYGVRADCLEVERCVKVARERKPNRADIVVLRDGHPYVVIECNKPKTVSRHSAFQTGESITRIKRYVDDYDNFLIERRKLMAAKKRAYYAGL